MRMLFSQRLALADQVENRIAKHERAMRRNRVISVPTICIGRTTANVIGILQELGYLRDKPEAAKNKKAAKGKQKTPEPVIPNSGVAAPLMD